MWRVRACMRVRVRVFALSAVVFIAQQSLPYLVIFGEGRWEYLRRTYTMLSTARIQAVAAISSAVSVRYTTHISTWICRQCYVQLPLLPRNHRNVLLAHCKCACFYRQNLEGVSLISCR